MLSFLAWGTTLLYLCAFPMLISSYGLFKCFNEPDSSPLVADCNAAFENLPRTDRMVSVPVNSATREDAAAFRLCTLSQNQALFVDAVVSNHADSPQDSVHVGSRSQTTHPLDTNSPGQS